MDRNQERELRARLTALDHEKITGFAVSAGQPISQLVDDSVGLLALAETAETFHRSSNFATDLGFDPLVVDGVFSESLTIRDMEKRWLASIKAGTHAWVSSAGRAGRKHFDPSLEPDRIADAETWAGKPRRGALFTTPSSPDKYGAWFAYMFLHSDEFPAPYRAWSLTAAETVSHHFVTSATEWCNLVETYPAETPDGGRGVSWSSAFLDFDVLHVSPRAVLSAALPMNWKGHTVAPIFWSVPTSIWARWRFSRIVELEPPPSDF